MDKALAERLSQSSDVRLRLIIINRLRDSLVNKEKVVIDVPF